MIMSEMYSCKVNGRDFKLGPGNPSTKDTIRLALKKRVGKQCQRLFRSVMEEWVQRKHCQTNQNSLQRIVAPFSHFQPWFYELLFL